MPVQKRRIMRLIDAEDNTVVEITGFIGGKGIADKLRQLSLMPGDEVKITQRAPFRGPVMVEAHGRSVALGRGVASRIEVMPCE